jgi:LPXTG-site transpeptidase (sortase) family protein
MFLRRLFNLAAVALVFALGVAGGAYYHNEIGVIWRSFLPAPAPPAPVRSEPASSTLSFAQLPEPLPLVYSDTLDEPRLQEYLKEGAVVLPLGTSFGEPGNVVVTAHSSGTAAFGPFRFAFAKLSELEAGQEFKVTTPAAQYTYRVYGKEIVWPHEVDKLPNDDRSTVTLVTCWPLWTNFKRLLVHAELTGVEYHI